MKGEWGLGIFRPNLLVFQICQTKIFSYAHPQLVCFNFLEMLIFTLSSFVYFCLVCFFEGEGWFRGWIEGIYMLAHLLCINFFHRTIWIFKDPSFTLCTNKIYLTPPPPKKKSSEVFLWYLLIRSKFAVNIRINISIWATTHLPLP